MTLKKLRSNYHRPTPAKWRAAADLGLILCGTVSGAVMGLPITDNSKLWINFSLTILSTTFKFITKFMANEPTSSPVDNSVHNPGI